MVIRKRSRRPEAEVTHRVLLGPKIDLHTGVHKAFAKLLDHSFQYRRRDSVHTFVMADEKHESPFGFFHWFVRVWEWLDTVLSGFLVQSRSFVAFDSWVGMASVWCIGCDYHLR